MSPELKVKIKFTGRNLAAGPLRKAGRLLEVIKVNMQAAGRCRCKELPDGKEGLNGYMVGEQYFFQFMRCVDPMKSYFRIWLSIDDPWYDCATRRVFKKYFEKVESNEREG